MLKVTEATKKALEALGCRPLLCHACAGAIDTGDVIGPNEGYFVHWPRCKDSPITLHRDAEARAKLEQELEEIGGLHAVLKGETGDWKSETTTEGPAFSAEEILAAMGGTPP